MDSLAVGLEVFRLPAAYATTLPMWSERADKVLDYALIDDNDDGDYWEDRWEHWDPLDPTLHQSEGCRWRGPGEPADSGRD